MSETKYDKVIFLDIDGVLNSTRFFETNSMKDGRDKQIDPEAVDILRNILRVTGAKVVLSSSWRKTEDGVETIRREVCPIEDITPSCCTGIRGAEIYKWINKNINYDVRSSFKYAIIDDDSDMLLWQKDNFFQTDHKIGLTYEVASAVINYFKK